MLFSCIFFSCKPFYIWIQRCEPVYSGERKARVGDRSVLSAAGSGDGER